MPGLPSPKGGWGKSFLTFRMDPQLCFSKRIVIMEAYNPVKLLLNRFGLRPLWQARSNRKPNANERTTWGAIHLGAEKHQERFGIVSGDEPRRTTQLRADLVFPDTSDKCKAQAVQKNIRTGNPPGNLRRLLVFLRLLFFFHLFPPATGIRPAQVGRSSG
jgi:hypothetical protein